MTLLSIFAWVIGPLVVVTGIGWAAAGRFTVDIDRLNRLVIYVLAPCLVFHGVTSLPQVGGAALRLPLGFLANLAGLAGLGLLVFGGLLRRRGPELRGILQPVMFPNNGNMGLPVCALAFGEEGLSLATVVFATASFLHFTVGVGILKGGRMGWLEGFRLPLVHALLLSLSLRGLGVELPLWLMTPLGWVGRAALPLMLFGLGCQLRLARVSTWQTAALAAALRLGGGFLIATATGWLLGLTGLWGSVHVVMASMPCAVITFIFAKAYGCCPEDVGGAILVSTLSSLLTLPLVLTWVAG